MANRTWRDLKGLGTKRRKICFRYFPQGSSSTPLTAAAGTLLGDGVTSVTRQSQGVFLATLDDAYLSCTGMKGSTQANALTGYTVEFGAMTMGSGATPTSVTIRQVDAAAAVQDIAANANNSVSIELDFEDSSA